MFISGQTFFGKIYCKEEGGRYQVAFKSADGTSLAIDAKISPFNKTSIFGSLEQASAFFEKGAVGFSPGNNHYDGLELETFGWKVESLEVTNVQSSFFADENVFPSGSVQFDNALLMTELKHEWHAVAGKSIQPAA